MTLRCVRARRGKRCRQERNENEATPERGLACACIRVIRQPQRALTDRVVQKEKRVEEEEKGADRKTGAIKGQREP